MADVAIMIPCLNEADAISQVISDCQTSMEEADIYVYDNGSTDDTIMKAIEAGAIVRLVADQGKGNVMKRVFEDSDYRCTIIIDGDDTYDVSILRPLYEAICHGCSMAVADRLACDYYRTSQKHSHKAGNYIINLLISCLFHVPVKDTLSGCRAFSQSFIKTYTPLSQGFTIETELTLQALIHREPITWIPVHYRPRLTGQSKIRTMRDGVHILTMIMHYYLRQRKHYETGQNT